MKLVNIGFGNLVSADKVVAVVSPESAPIKRMVQEAKERGVLIDATFGRRTKAVLITTWCSLPFCQRRWRAALTARKSPRQKRRKNMDKGLLLVISAPSGGVVMWT